jgi:TPR repeat protein
VTDGPRLSASEIAALMVRGDAFLAAGDIASARLFFERAADSGDGRAAMRMAVTYDAAVLERAGLRGRRGDPERATFWSRRAHELGEGKAGPPLSRLGTSGSAEPLLQPR